MTIYIDRAHITQAKCDHARDVLTTQRNHTAKIEVMRQHDSVSGACLLDDYGIIHTLQPLIA